MGRVESLVALIRTGKRRREMAGVSRVLGRLDSDRAVAREMLGVSGALGRLDLAEHLPAP